MISQDHLFLDEIDIQKFYEEALHEMKTNKLIRKNNYGTIFRFDANYNFHHETKPSIINPTKNSSSLIWFKNNEYDRDHYPASIEKDERILIWYKKGKEHRIGGFSTIDFKKNIYKLNIEGHLFEEPMEYLKVSKEWAKADPYNKFSSHDKIKIIEDLEKKLLAGYFDQNLWKNGHFLGQG